MKKVRILVLFMMVLCFCFGGQRQTYAAFYKSLSIARATDTKDVVSKIFKVNLDGKGKTEKVKVTFSHDDSMYTIAVNGKELLTGPGYTKMPAKGGMGSGNWIQGTVMALVDLNKKDKTKELLAVTGNEIILYRYSKTAGLKQIAYGKQSHKKKNILKAGSHTALGISTPPGNGRVPLVTQVFSGKKSDNYIMVHLYYKIKNKKLVLDQDVEHVVNKDTVYGIKNKLNATSEFTAYNKNNPYSSGIEKKFIIPQGAEYEVLKLKVGKMLSAMQVKYDGHKGWIFMKTDNLYI